MARVTVFCVQPFWLDRRKLVHGQRRQFKKAEEALRAGEAAARRNAGAIVYSVEGDPEYDDWAEPKVLASLGQVPEVVF